MATLAASSSRAVVRPASRRASLVRSPTRAVRPVQGRGRTTFRVRAESETEPAYDVDKIVKDLQEKWDSVENKTAVVTYGAGAIAVLWFSNTVVGALNSLPLFPKLFELVGLGYSAWFTYRFLLFKSGREELVQELEELKSKIAGTEK